MDRPNDINFDTEISGEGYIEVSDHSKDEEDDTCIEISNITMNQPLNFIEDLPWMLPTKFRFIWLRGFRED